MIELSQEAMARNTPGESDAAGKSIASLSLLQADPQLSITRTFLTIQQDT